MLADTDLLDDAEARRSADPSDMLGAVASAGAQVRQALLACERSALDRIT